MSRLKEIYREANETAQPRSITIYTTESLKGHFEGWEQVIPNLTIDTSVTASIGLETLVLSKSKLEDMYEQLKEELTPKPSTDKTTSGLKIFVSGDSKDEVEQTQQQQLILDAVNHAHEDPDSTVITVLTDPADPRIANLPERLQELVVAKLDNSKVRQIDSIEELQEYLATVSEAKPEEQDPDTQDDLRDPAIAVADENVDPQPIDPPAITDEEVANAAENVQAVVDNTNAD